MHRRTPDEAIDLRALSEEDANEIAGGDNPSIDLTTMDLGPVYEALVDATSALIEAVDQAIK